MKQDTIIIAGAGAAGLFCAWLLSRAGFSITLLEGGSKAARKLSISGGGHANFSNRIISPDNYYSPPLPKFCQKALANFGVRDSIDLCTQLGLEIREKEHGKLFLVEPATTFATKLLDGCADAGCRILCNDSLEKAEYSQGLFCLHSAKGIHKAAKLVLALGSPARPGLARCANCWQIAHSLGHKIIPPKPALTSIHFTSGKYAAFAELAGISLEATVSLDGVEYGDKKLVWHDDILFTHKGLSGPAILNATLFSHSGSRMHIDFLPHYKFECLLDDNEKRTPHSILKKFLPDRLVKALLPPPLGDRKAAELSRANRQIIGAAVNDFILDEFSPDGLNNAEVCAGGVDVREINPASMQSLKLPQLYIIGEMLNVTGELGGYNLHWAFASAHAAAKSIADKHKH